MISRPFRPGLDSHYSAQETLIPYMSMRLPKKRKTPLGIAALLIGVLVSIFALTKYVRGHALHAQIERLRQQGAIVENYHLLLEADSRSLAYAGLLIALIGFGVGSWLLCQAQKNCEVSV